LQDLDREQNELVTKFLNARTGDANARAGQRQQFQQQLNALNEKRQELERARNQIISSSGGGPISLLATAGAVVTGLNLLSNGLVKSGANPDQGSIIFNSNVS
jgi:ABC-type transport system involved in cytochrome bd biosynthesis fused ATPase/permease subunit